MRIQIYNTDISYKPLYDLKVTGQLSSVIIAKGVAVIHLKGKRRVRGRTVKTETEKLAKTEQTPSNSENR